MSMIFFLNKYCNLQNCLRVFLINCSICFESKSHRLSNFWWVIKYRIISWLFVGKISSFSILFGSIITDEIFQWTGEESASFAIAQNKSILVLVFHVISCQHYLDAYVFLSQQILYMNLKYYISDRLYQEI